jgi:hypothetical protein
MTRSASFSNYLTSNKFLASGWRLSNGVRERMVAANIKSQAALLRWFRERYPHDYARYHFIAGMKGREIMMELWANYLQWIETREG